jgi:hypothetical protein
MAHGTVQLPVQKRRSIEAVPKQLRADNSPSRRDVATHQQTRKSTAAACALFEPNPCALESQHVHPGEQITPANISSSLAGAVLLVPFEEDGQIVWWQGYCVSVDVSAASVCLHYLNNDSSLFQNYPWRQPDHLDVTEEKILLHTSAEQSVDCPIDTLQVTISNMSEVLSTGHGALVHIFCVDADVPFAVHWSEATVICADRRTIRVRYASSHLQDWVHVDQRHVRVRGTFPTGGR